MDEKNGLHLSWVYPKFRFLYFPEEPLRTVVDGYIRAVNPILSTCSKYTKKCRKEVKKTNNSSSQPLTHPSPLPPTATKSTKKQQ